MLDNFVNKKLNVAGTSLVGTVNTSYRRLVERFGEPTLGRSDDEKVQVEWHIKFKDGVIATIYDWKEVTTPDAVTEWHVGGFEHMALVYVIDELV